MIAEEFFSGQWRGLPVYLDLEADILARIAQRAGARGSTPQSQFIKVIKSTLNLPPTDDRVFRQHREMLRYWRHAGTSDPPWCTALLAFLSLVAEGMTRDERFSASNYYGRLCDMLGVTGDVHKNKVQRDFRIETHELWDALNSWLDETEHAFGRPTAYAFDHRRHVGVPISQALVKQHDRDHLRTLFAEYSLLPGQRLPLAEMIRLLEEWIPRSNVSKALKHLWRRQHEARSRVAAVAQLELEAWTGDVDLAEGDIRREAPLLMVAAVRSHPLPRLDLSLLVRRSSAIPCGRYGVVADAPETAQAALESCGGSLLLRESGFEGWLEFEEASTISFPDLILANMVLERVGEGPFTLRRLARRLLLLKLDEALRLYIESTRAELSETYLVLVHNSIAEEVNDFLTKVASPGFEQLKPDTLRGLPQGWVAFHRVIIMATAETILDDLNVLTPLSTTQVSLGGGFALPGHSTWHSAFPPEVRAAALDEGDVRVRLINTQSLDGQEYPVEGIPIATFTASTSIDLGRQEPALGDGDYRILLKRLVRREQDEVLSTIGFRLRSADHPRPSVGGRILRLKHHFSIPGWAAVSATEEEGAGKDTAIVVGATVIANGQVFQPADVSTLLLPPIRPGDPGVQDPDSEGLDPEQATHARGATPPCFAGFHHWLLPPVLPECRLPAEIHGRCKHCGLEKWFFRRRRQRRASVKLKTREQERRRQTTPGPVGASIVELPPTGKQRYASFDELLDALAFARGGNWQSFLGLASQVDESPWFPVEAARLLSALGHIDVSLGRKTFRPQTWSIAPPVLVVLHKGDEAVLCGARPKRMLDRLKADVESIGGTFHLEPNSLGPSVVRVGGLDHQGLNIVAESVSDAAGLPLAVRHNTPLELLSILPPLRKVAATLHTASWRSFPAEVYDFDSATWRPVHEFKRPGAYRFRVQPWLYAYVSEASVRDRRIQVGDVRLVKHLAAITCGRSVIGYDRNRQRLVTPWGSQLPGLYERAVVLCSGEPPIKMTDGTVEYLNVPAAVAAALWQRFVQAAY